MIRVELAGSLGWREGRTRKGGQSTRQPHRDPCVLLAWPSQNMKSAVIVVNIYCGQALLYTFDMNCFVYFLQPPVSSYTYLTDEKIEFQKEKPRN